MVHPFNANGCLGMRLFIGILIETISQSQNSCEHTTGTWYFWSPFSEKFVHVDQATFSYIQNLWSVKIFMNNI